VPLGFEPFSELLEVVDLAVEDDLDRAIFVADRLVPAGQVDDGQTTMRQTDPRLDPEALGIGPAMGDRIAHRLKHSRIDRTVAIGVEDASNSAHRLLQSCLGGADGEMARVFLPSRPVAQPPVNSR
jgi:hypothetical protein